MSYFVVTTIDSLEMDFDKKCNSINYKDEKYIVFNNEETKGVTTLALIPHSRIKTIKNVISE